MSIVTIPDRWGLRGGTAADLATVNEIPLKREAVIEDDTGLIKVGDGVTHWNDLDYINTPPGGGGSYTPPLSTNFTAFGSGLTIYDRTNRMVWDKTSGGPLSGMMRSVPTAPYTLDAKIQMVSPPQNGNAVVCGLGLSDGTKYRGFYVGSWGVTTTSPELRYAVDGWDTTASFNSSVKMLALHMFGGEYFLRITDSGTTRKYWLSTNGLDFDEVYSEASNTFVTPTTCGIVCYNASGDSKPMKAVIQHWAAANSVLGDAS